MRFRRSGSPKRTSRTTIPTLAVLISLASVLLVPTPATAGSAWDPNDAGYRLDIRWVGVYQESDGRLRVTVVFYDPVRLQWFRTGSGSPFESRSAVAFTDDRDRRHVNDSSVLTSFEFANPFEDFFSNISFWFNHRFPL